MSKPMTDVAEIARYCREFDRMTSTDTLLPCPFCGGAAEMRGGGMINCQRCGAEAFGPKWQRRTPPTPATDEREAVARAIADALAVDPNDGREREAMQRLHDKCADAALSALAPYRAAEILAAEANERARIVAWLREDALRSWGADCSGDDELTFAANAIEHGAGK